jgi:hypothetical protein
MKLYKKIIAAIIIINLLYNVYQVFMGVSLISLPDPAYRIGGVLGLLWASSYSFWLISSASAEGRYREPGRWATKSIAILSMVTLLFLMFYGFYSNIGQVELIYDLLAMAIMLALYLPLVIYDLKLIFRSRSLS